MRRIRTSCSRNAVTIASLFPEPARWFRSAKLCTVENLMGFPFLRNVFVEGLFARLMYRTLRLMHDRAIGGTSYAVLRLLARALARRTGPPVKLH